MDLKAKIKELTQGKELRNLGDADLKKLTIPYIKEGSEFQIPVATALTVVLPGFESDAYDSVILILLDDTGTGPAGVGEIISSRDTRIVIEQNTFKAGDRVRIVPFLHLKSEGIYDEGLKSDYYTFG